MFVENIEWIESSDSTRNVEKDHRWPSFRSVVAALEVITAEVPGFLRGSISEWYSTVVGQVDVDLSSERLDEDEDDLTAVQAAALRSILSIASNAATGGGRLAVAVYRQKNSAYVSLTSDSIDLHRPLADLTHLFEECVSYLTCVQVEGGWLVEVRYKSPITPTTLADLGKSLDANTDQRRDLVPLAQKAAALLSSVENGKSPDSADYRWQAAELLRRRGLI
jgi:hypothetical protein